MFWGIILAQLRRPVASSEAQPLPLGDAPGYVPAHCHGHQNGRFAGVFVDCCVYACCPGSCWGDTERVVSRCRRPVASGVALDMLHRAMMSVSHQRNAVAIEMAGG